MMKNKNADKNADKGVKVKNSWKTIMVMIVTVAIAVLMYIAIFGNGSGIQASFTSEAEFESVKITQTSSGALDKTTRANITIQTGDEFLITTDSQNGKETLECTVEDGILTINLATSQDILGEFFSSKSSTILITIPQSYQIEAFSVKAELGNFDFENISAESFVFDGDNTIVDIVDCNFDSSSVASNLGNVSAYDTAFGEFTFTGGTSNPEFKNCTFGNFDCYIAFGNLLVSTAEIEEINLTADMGYVDFSNITLAGDMYAYADYGAVVISFDGDVSNFILDCSISESGKYYLDENLQQGKDETLQQLTIKTYIGDIDVSFVE